VRFNIHVTARLTRGIRCRITAGCPLFESLRAIKASLFRTNPFEDPFAQATSNIKNRPIAEPPLYTEEQVRREMHIRVEKGTTCWYRGRCLLPNAYKYDKLINEAVVRAITVRPEFAATSVWVASERRIVYLKGCVANAQQKKALVAVAGKQKPWMR
jgi:hypothetical protein